MIEQVFPFDPAPWVALVVAALSLALFTSHSVDAGYAYARHHDDRAALDLLVALTQTVASVGLTISAAGPMAEVLGLALREDMRNVGFGIVAGGLLVTSGTMFLIDRTQSKARR